MRLADLRGRSVAVWGTGREGRAAVTAIAAHRPARLMAVDDSANFLSVPWEGDLARLAPLAGGEHAFGALAAADVVVRSPGVPQTHPWMAELRGRGITITGGSALWLADHAAATVGVTGSKGKSTTSSLISHLLAAAGRPNVFGGNIGVPLLDLPEAERYVLELSSYQCSDLTDSPRVAVVTSLFPEHLDAHGGEREYYRDKLNLLAHGPELIVINGADERLVAEVSGRTDASGFAPVPAAAGDSRFRVDADDLVYCSDEPLFPRSAFALRGVHNGRNLCVALAVLDGLGVDVRDPAIEAAVRGFRGLPHRLAEIEDPSGVTFVDDTLSTSPYSAMHAIDAYLDRPLTVLVGGTDRGLDYAPLREHLRDRELTVIGIPDSGPRIVAELAGLPGVRTEVAEDLPAAVGLARKVTPAGGVVLLSPAAPSYGRYRNFEHRSEAFVEAVRDTAV
ncbi:UDP-N-acetylmuramoyl-L-alanine--D-glutamate ligase [Jidongwangia harbinensis]|uniref:UDP-N-acetylmuramoyl-L-alanine--D-glutamate ligase n=1 Tax=Jidongwangia harbinensis TaxID=2878561 RepID=UPI001CDA01DF|nr:UDP-N-acetylmuramoyl-L-alanine--D-glutamate ligase [Jidongwangia harbinensis]MCA2218550.1 UDP-N-acetylmuramoyl-L-alanine--D-glutamate ligase [Jidongwangia harbinensis]